MLLLDTQIVVWLALDPERIPDKVIAILAESRSAGPLSIASVSLWEIANLEAKGRLDLDPPISVFLDRVERNYRIFPLTGHVALRAAQFSKRYPKDPADRQIGATAIVHGLTLVTADRLIRKSGEVPCIW